MKTFFTALFLTLLAASSCNKSGRDGDDPLQRLYWEYKEGSISECMLDGKKVYTAISNAYDAGGVIYDLNGKKLGECNYAWGPVDSICERLQSCETIYRSRDNISGQPFVDKYNLSNSPD